MKKVLLHIFQTTFLVVAFAPLMGVNGATLVVTSLADSGPGTLRQMVMNASPGDTIKFSVSGSIILLSGPILVNKDLVIQSQHPKAVTVDGGNSSRMFDCNGSVVEIKGLSLMNGNAPGGAAVQVNGGNVVLAGCRIENNSSSANGGCISISSAIFRLRESSISGGNASLNGGGIFVSNSSNSTITNSTISGNLAGGQGGGIWCDATSAVFCESSTIASNTTLAQGGGVYALGSSLSARNTIFADNIGPNPDCNGQLNSLGNNLIENMSGCLLVPMGDISGIDPQLLPLMIASTGTFMHGLSSTSPCLESGLPAVLPPRDQKDHPRELDADLNGNPIVDIGAFEFSPICVTNVLDAGLGSLRDAILQANSNSPVLDVICFNIPGPGPHVISPGLDYPSITDTVIIDGYSQPSSQVAVGPIAADIRIVVANLGANTGFDFAPSSEGSDVMGLAINGGFLQAINVDADNVWIQGNHIGTDASGNIVSSNTTGIVIGTADNVLIGGAIASTRNVISGNTNEQVIVNGGGTNNQIRGNYIGPGSNGFTPFPVSGEGIAINNALNTVIGGTLFSERNVISGNSAAGIRLDGGSVNGTMVQGNWIGLDANGLPLGNGGPGIMMQFGTNGNTIGGLAPQSRNFISGNGGDGVMIIDIGTSGNSIQGNFIGLDTSGAGPIPNMFNGILIANGAAGNTIGGPSLASGNVISGNIGPGVTISDPNTNGNMLTNNLIGVDLTGVNPLGNVIGVQVVNGAQSNNIGNGSMGNVISGNFGQGVLIEGLGTDDNVVQGNNIGIDITGNFSVPNLEGVTIAMGASNNIIGYFANTVDANVISGNNGIGVLVVDAGTSGNLVRGNMIGTDPSGSGFAIPNTIGVGIGSGATNNRIGGAVNPEGNVISGNDTAGVIIGDPGTSFNLVQGNHIGTNLLGDDTIPNATGVAIIDGATDNTVGGFGLLGNQISGNILGVVIDGFGTQRDTVIGNFIGIDAGGTLPLGNQLGVAISGSAYNNWIVANIVSANFTGVVITDPGTDSNKVYANNIGTDWLGNNPLGNTSHGVNIVAGAGRNLIGGSQASGYSNVISNNGDFGVAIENIGTNNNVVQGNFIGTDYGATVAMPNKHGVGIADRASFNTIGGSILSDANIISGNDSVGVWFQDTCTFNWVYGNAIGTDFTGTSAMGNKIGVVISDRASWNQVGNPTGAQLNVISGNDSTGVVINGGGTSWNSVLSNLIGVDTTGVTALPNGGFGVEISDGAAINGIGGGALGDGNVISGNGLGGIHLNNGYLSLNWVQGNRIGVDWSGTQPVSNGGHGIWSSGNFSSANIGGATPLTANVIGANNGCGILLEGSGGHTIQSNFIGTDTTGALNLGNTQEGIRVNHLGPLPLNNLIGDSITAGAHNTVSFNGGDGIQVLSNVGARMFGNTLISNTGLGIDLANDGVTVNDPMDSDVGPNGLQNYPIITYAINCTGGSYVQGVVESQANRSYYVEFFDVGTAGDPTGNGEAMEFEGSKNVNTDALGMGNFAAVLPNANFSGAVTAIATDITFLAPRNTSELSANFTTFSTQLPGPVVSNDTSYCLGSVLAPMQAISDDTLFTILWYTDTLQAPIDSGQQALPLNQAGVTTYYVTQSILGCESYSSNITITIDSLTATFASSIDTVCFGSCNGDATVAVSGGTAPYTYAWSSGGFTQSVSGLCGGPYTVTITDVAGCTDSFNYVIIENPVPTINTITPDTTICEGACADFTFFFTGNGPFTVYYNDGSSSFLQGGMNNGSSIQVCPLVTTTYTMDSLADAIGCLSNTVAQQRTVTVNPLPPKPFATSPQTTYCQGDSILTMTAVGASGGLISWYDDSMHTTLLATGPSHLPVLNSGSNSFYITETSNGCESRDTVLVIDLVDASFVDAGPDVVICLGDSTQLVATGGGTYQWFGEPTLSDSTIATPWADPTVTTTYWVWITTPGGCGFQDTVQVEVDAVQVGCGFHIYSGITPNGDGTNDTWIIDGIEFFPDNTVFIFNRWGKRLQWFRGYNNRDVSWDGTGPRGELVADGTYFYLVSLGNGENLNGWVQVTR